MSFSRKNGKPPGDSGRHAAFRCAKIRSRPKLNWNGKPQCRGFEPAAHMIFSASADYYVQGCANGAALASGVTLKYFSSVFCHLRDGAKASGSFTNGSTLSRIGR